MKKNRCCNDVKSLFYQILRKMKLTMLLLFVTVLTSIAADSYSQSTKLTLRLENVRIEDLLNKIEDQSQFRFFYNEEINLDKKVSIDVSTETITNILEKIFGDKGIHFEIIGRQIILSNSIDSNNNSSQQQKTVSGKVTDSSGGSLPGVSVVVKGTTTGVITDMDGKYTIAKVPANATLQFSFVGMKSQEITVGNKTGINVTLAEESIRIEEVVAVGYGTQKKVSLTAAVGTINSTELTNIPVANVSNALSGQVAGLITAQTSGEIGNDQTEIHIRGLATNGNSSPLVIVDGVPRSFNELNMNDIESITVLKDAAAVAPYGMGGANGVILVTSKHGKTSKPKLSYSGYYGLQNPTTMVKMLNSYDYARMKNIAVKNQDPNAILPFSDEAIAGYKKSVLREADAEYDRYPNSNAIQAVQNRNTPITEHHVSLNGGSEFINYYAGIGYQYQEGMWATSNSNKYNLSLSADIKPTNLTTVGIMLNGYDQVIASPSSSGLSVMSMAQAYLPTDAIYYSNGLLANSQGRTVAGALNSGSRYADTYNNFIQMSVEQLLPFIKGLKVKGVINYNITKGFNKNWTDPAPTYYNINTTVSPYIYSAVVSTDKSSLSESINNNKAKTYQGMLNYDRVFGSHSVSILAVMETRNNLTDLLNASRSNYDINIHELDLGSPNQLNWGNGGTSSKSSQVGYVYRLGYQYEGKYLFEATGRYDGHYYFAPGKRYGFFPAFSVGWRISEEKFIKENAPWINNLKLRGSWGKSGNLAGGPFQYSSGMLVYGNSYVMNNILQQGVSERLEANPNITWEVAKKTDVGFDVDLWNGLLNAQFDYFYEKRDNMLITPDAVIPAEYGIGVAQENQGIMKNSGIDFSIGGKHKFSNGISLNYSFNFTYSANKLLEIAENPITKNDPNRSRTGRALNTPFGLKADGLFQVSDFNPDGTLKAGIPVPQFSKVGPGDIKWVDMNGDGKVDASDETALGYPRLPQINYGLNGGISYKRFNLTFLFQGAAQTNVFIASELAYPFLVGGNAAEISKDYWTPENPNATYPKLYGNGGNNNTRANPYNNDFFKRSGAYLRLKNTQFSYSLPESILKTVQIQSLKLFLSAQNLLTFSQVKDLFDPEMGETGKNDSNERGWYYPKQKAITFGVDVVF